MKTVIELHDKYLQVSQHDVSPQELFLTASVAVVSPA